MSTYNISELFESVVGVAADRMALVTPTRRLTYAELDARANRLAHHLDAAGIGPGDHVGLQLLNGTEYLEGMLAAFKLRAVPININYRYVERELEYLYDNADLVALIFHRRFAPVVEAVAPSCTKLTHFIAVEDGTDEPLPVGTVEYETALAVHSPDNDFTGRSSDDLYIAYTGGTTGMPKGVVWRHEDVFFAALGGGDPTFMLGPISSPEEIAGRVPATGAVFLYTPPFMHVSAHWGAFHSLFGGGCIVMGHPGAFDPAETLALIERERVNLLTVVGDAMARPLLDLLAEDPDRYDTSSLFALASGGAAVSPSTKEQARKLLPNAMLIDGFGSSETGVLGTAAPPSEGATKTGGRFSMSPQTAVLDDDLRPVEPGSGVIGRLARTGYVPIGYYKDEEKTATTFVEHDGVRWVLPGDMALVEADGTVVVLGRGSASINTGGEKVYPEEVEVVLKAHPDVFDAIVVGVADERWGQRVVAVAATRSEHRPSVDELREFCRADLAGYKIPRAIVWVDTVERGPNGKADYRWARAKAEATTA